jgi:hypothetical protein
MENNNIDKTFNEASKTLEEPATFPGFDKVWAKVEERLDKKEEKKKILPMWLPYGIAASLLIGSGIFYFNNKKENVTITKPVIAQNTVILQKNTVVAVPEHIQKVDSMLKENIQNEILPQEPMKIAYQPAPNVSVPSLYSPVYEMTASQASHEDATPALEGRTMDTLKRQNIEEVIAMGIKKEKSSMVNSLASSTRKKMSDLNAVADTAEVAYPNSPFDLKEQTQEPSILAYNKGYLKTNQPVAINSGYGNRIGSKADINTIRGSGVPGVNINSISGTLGSGKVDIVVHCQSSVYPNLNPLYIINGISSDAEAFKNLDPKRIVAMRVFKGEKAVALFGNKAVNGAILIETKDISKKEKRKLKKLLKDDLPKK